MMNWWQSALATGAVSFFAAVTPLQAASLRMTPIGLDLAVPEKAGAISLTNTAGEDVNIQVRIFKWTQEDGKDVLSETRDVLVSPPAATIKPQETYTLRVVRLASRPVSGEETYRLVIDELPKPVDPRAASQGVRMVLRTSMPIFFVEPTAIPDLSFKAWRSEDKFFIEASNVGKRHAKLAGTSLTSPAGDLSFGAGLNGYILPGETMKFEVPAGKTLLVPGPATLLSGPGSSLEVKQAVTVESR